MNINHKQEKYVYVFIYLSFRTKGVAIQGQY